MLVDGVFLSLRCRVALVRVAFPGGFASVAASGTFEMTQPRIISDVIRQAGGIQSGIINPLLQASFQGERVSESLYDK